MSVSVTIENVQKEFGRYPALRGVSLDVAEGELVALLGPSGSGKTTLLRIVAGLEEADGGRVMFGDLDATRLSLRERRIAGCAMDVGRAADQMPSPELARLPNVIATPHVGGLVPEAVAHQALETTHQVAAIVNGQAPPGAVNPEHASRLARLA